MRLYLQKSFFTERETLLLREGTLTVHAFRYSTGVEALRVTNDRGYFVILPYQGQQIWDFHFGGRDLTMKTLLTEPIEPKQFLDTYGGFLYHCGLASVGAPDESHPQHGEIPNGKYKDAYIDCERDERGTYVSVGGTLACNIAYVKKYDFCPECRLYEGADTVRVNVSVTNGRAEPMEYAYLCHINFRPFDGARLIYSVPRDAEHIKIHKIVPDSLPAEAQAKLRGYMDILDKNITRMDEVGNPDEAYAPEVCFTMKYNPDENGRGYTMQYIEGEGACYVDHPVDALPIGIRWISRTPTEDAMGMVLPATSEHLGYKHAKANGYMRLLGGYETFSFHMEIGFITDTEAKKVAAKIEKLI